MKTGIEQISEERVKQIAKHGYTAYHDTGYKNKELLFGALTYLKKAMWDNGFNEEAEGNLKYLIKYFPFNVPSAPLLFIRE